MKPYKIALLTGTHQHRWADDGSGICAGCHIEHFPHNYSDDNPGVCLICGAVGKCQHEAFEYFNSDYHQCKLCYAKMPHNKIFTATENICWQCQICGCAASHKFSDGVCEECGWTCPHISFVDINSDEHKCKKCGMSFPHSMNIVGSRLTCTRCSCGRISGHSGINSLGDVCTVCGYVHNSHEWSDGHCLVCGAVCLHEQIGSDGKCTVCGMYMNLSGGIYGYGSTGGYDGSYVLERTGNGFEVYKGNIWTNGRWTSNGYYLFIFDIREDPIQFGGNYAYKITGYVFTKSSSVNVAPELLTADGVRHLKLAQYNLDGTLRDSDTTGHTAEDCMFISSSGMDKNPTWSA